jgi:RNA polymerase sigma-70 factor (ECF subfamily)
MLMVSKAASPTRLVENHEVHEAVMRLRPKYRTAITLYYWHGYSYEDIALYMQVPVSSIRGWLHRAKKQLKEALS